MPNNESFHTDFTSRYPPNPLPDSPYIGLFGNHHNDWRQWVTKILVSQGIAESQVYDPTDLGWQAVSDVNGDDLQWWIDELVKRQHQAMSESHCIIVSLDSRTREWGHGQEGPAVPAASDTVEGKIFAARSELGWLAGIRKKTFVWVPNDLRGRNYLRAVIGLYESLVPVQNLREAAIAAGNFTMESKSAPGCERQNPWR